jgi:hypothetical protein
MVDVGQRLAGAAAADLPDSCDEAVGLTLVRHRRELHLSPDLRTEDGTVDAAPRGRAP